MPNCDYWVLVCVYDFSINLGGENGEDKYYII